MSESVDVPQIDPDEAERRLSGGATLLDVRELDEWVAGHAPDASHLAMNDVPDRIIEYARDVDLVVVCRSGSRSQRVAQWLRAQGFVTLNLAGGMRAWSAAGLPVITDTGDPGEVI